MEVPLRKKILEFHKDKVSLICLTKMIFLNRIIEFIELSFYFSNSQMDFSNRIYSKFYIEFDFRYFQFDMARTNNLIHRKEEYICII